MMIVTFHGGVGDCVRLDNVPAILSWASQRVIDRKSNITGLIVCDIQRRALDVIWMSRHKITQAEPG